MRNNQQLMEDELASLGCFLVPDLHVNSFKMLTTKKAVTGF